MVKCRICNKKYKMITKNHLKRHNIEDLNQYKLLFPSAQIYDDGYLKKISELTKKGMNNPETKSKLRYKKTKEHIEKMSKSISNLHKEGYYDEIYTKERNDKISKAKKEYWKNNDTNIIQEWLSEWVGSEKHIEMCKSNQVKASRKIRGKKISKPEKEFALNLKSKNIKFKQQFEVGGYPFDFYIPSENLLVEIDGEFYHPLNEKDCIYDLQKHNFKRDKIKNKVAEENGYKLKRIRV
jgi:very-short-patch-repair endonuclease